MGNIREDYRNKLEKLQEILNESEEVDYVTDSVYQIYKYLIDHEQFFDFEVDKPLYAKRLIRCYRYISNVILDLKNVERIVIGGLYTIADVCIMPRKLVDEASKNNPLSNIDDPELYGLPSHDKVNYATRKTINDKIVVALVKGSWTDEQIYTASQYDYVTLT